MENLERAQRILCYIKPLSPYTYHRFVYNAIYFFLLIAGSVTVQGKASDLFDLLDVISHLQRRLTFHLTFGKITSIPRTRHTVPRDKS